MLRIGHRGIACGEAEEFGVELIDVIEHRRGVHISRQTPDVVGHAGGAHLFLAEDADRFDAGREVAPERVEIVCPGKPPTHSDDGNRFKCLCRAPGPGFPVSVVLHRAAAAFEGSVGIIETGMSTGSPPPALKRRALT